MWRCARPAARARDQERQEREEPVAPDDAAHVVDEREGFTVESISRPRSASSERTTVVKLLEMPLAVVPEIARALRVEVRVERDLSRRPGRPSSCGRTIEALPLHA